MSRFFDDAQRQHAVHTLAMPALERISVNRAARDRALARFDQDEPPPYESSTEPSVHDYDREGVPDTISDLPSELRERMDEPLSDAEVDELVAGPLRDLAEPASIYRKTLTNLLEKGPFVVRLQGWEALFGGTKLVLLIVRHIVKRNWRDLGVWNKDWGVPGREVGASDDMNDWKWSWQTENPKIPEPLVARQDVEQNRENGRRGEGRKRRSRLIGTLRKKVGAAKRQTLQGGQK